MLGFNRVRTVDVAVAVYFAGPEVGFLLAFNPKWKGYAFPSRRIRDTDASPAFAALEAFRDAVGLPQRGATAEPLFYSEVKRESQRTGQLTNYRYHVFQIQPSGGAALDVPTGAACRLLYLPVGGFATADLVTWTARHVIGELVENQNVAVAVVVREGRAGREYLMVQPRHYGGAFPVASRIRADVSARFQAREGFRTDTGYQPATVAGEPVVVTDRHHSPRFGCDRQFVYHLVRLELPGVDLHDPNGPLAEAMRARECLGRWVPDADLDDPAANGLSETIGPIRGALRGI